MSVTLIAKTMFLPPEPETVDGWTTDVDGGEALIEFAGRECYQSWHKPNPETATNFGYITKSILSHSHFSVIEHATATFRFTGIPRSLTHEFIRHRHFSYSELSQRYVDMSTARLIEPPALYNLTGQNAANAMSLMAEVAGDAEANYERATNILKEAGFKGKAARQAARCVLPEATETRIVVTGNLRAWRHFINLRAAVHADAAIRETAIATLRILQSEYPAVFGDYRIRTLETGETVAEGQYNDVS
jgi:thymidylate synthase (FAD)